MEDNEYKPRQNDGNMVAGLILVALGVIFLLIKYFPEIDFKDLWPYILIVVGVFLFLRGIKNK